MYRAGTARVSAICPGRRRLFSDDVTGFNGLEPLKEAVGQHQSTIARSVGHRTARGRQLLARPAAKIAFIRFQLPLHDLSDARVANSSLLILIRYPGNDDGITTIDDTDPKNTCSCFYARAFSKCTESTLLSATDYMSYCYEVERESTEEFVPLIAIQTLGEA